MKEIRLPLSQVHTQEMVIMILEWKKKDSSQLPIKRLRSCTISTQPH